MMDPVKTKKARNCEEKAEKLDKNKGALCFFQSVSIIGSRETIPILF